MHRKLQDRSKYRPKTRKPPGPPKEAGRAAREGERPVEKTTRAERRREAREEAHRAQRKQFEKAARKKGEDFRRGVPHNRAGRRALARNLFDQTPGGGNRKRRADEKPKPIPKGRTASLPKDVKERERAKKQEFREEAT